MRGEARPLLWPEDKPGVAHAEGIEDVLAEVVLERLSAETLDGLTDPVGADAVFPAVARIADQRDRRGRPSCRSSMVGIPA